MQFAIAQASLTIEPLVTKLNPIKQQEFGIPEFLSALTAGLAFFGTPALGGSVASAAGSAFTVGVQQAPGVGKAIWPSGTTDVSMQRRSAEYAADTGNLVSIDPDQRNQLSAWQPGQSHKRPP